MSELVSSLSCLWKRRGKRKIKPYITLEQVDELVNLITALCATMVYVAIYTGLL